MTQYDGHKDSHDSYLHAIGKKREELLLQIPGVKRARRIGQCDLLQGDCLEIMPGLEQVDAVVTDPPYEQSFQDKLGTMTRSDGGPEFQGVRFDGIDKIRKAVVEQSGQIARGWFIAFCTLEGVAKWADEINASPCKYKKACVWVKPDCTPQMNGQGPATGAECFVTAWCGAGHAKWNAGGKRGVYRHLVNPSDRQGEHPTEKPWRLFVELLEDFTTVGQTVLDPFMGSGTTLAACAKLGRSGIGIELDPDYFDIACKRVEEAYRQPDLFVEQPKPPTQEAMDL